MDRSTHSRWVLLPLSAGLLYVTGCGQPAASHDAQTADLPSVASFAASHPRTDPATRYALPARLVAAEVDAAPVAVVPANDSHSAAECETGVPSSASLAQALPEKPPAFELEALDETNHSTLAEATESAQRELDTNPVAAPPIAAPDNAPGAPASSSDAKPTSAVGQTHGPRLAQPDAKGATAEPEFPARRSVLMRHGSPDSGAERGMLPWANARRRSADIEVVSARSMGLCREAFRLADRGASYAARRKFVDALRQVAMALDLEQQTDMYTKALAAGMTALKESHDFVAHGATEQIDVKFVVASHKTPVLKNGDHHMMGTVALQQYYTYAQEQLAAAAGQEVAGSMALYGLGRVTLGPSSSRSQPAQDQIGRAVLFYQAALLADNRNFLASNELAVLLADAGRLEQARSLLMQSLVVVPQADVWHNLAVVHARLGDRDMAARAQNQALAVRAASPGSTAGAQVRWVDPTTFAHSHSMSDSLQVPMTAVKPAAPAARSAQAQPPARAAKSPAKAPSGISAWLPWGKPTRR